MAGELLSKCPKCKTDLKQPMSVCNKCGIVFSKYTPQKSNAVASTNSPLPQCKMCKKSVSENADTCPHCGEPKPVLQRGETIETKIGNGCAGLVLGTFAIIFAVGMCTSRSGSGTGQTSKDDLLFGAKNVCEQFVSDRLKSPGSAKFSEYNKTRISEYGGTYNVTGYVDAQNGFGALLRNNYLCVVKHKTGNDFSLVSLTLDQK